MRSLIVSLILSASISTMALPSSAETVPEQIVSVFHRELLKALGEQAGENDQSRYMALEHVMDSAFNFDVMIKTVSGRHWRKANESERKRLRRAFRDVSIATYADQYAGLTNATFQTITTRQGPRGLKLVDTELSTSTKTIGLTYVVRQKNDAWQIIDILLDGGKVSELARKASEYSKTLKDGGAAALIEVLENQKKSLLEN